jgi:LacI family transcriptional regulator
MVTIKDVAKDAGVSLGTVSKIINGIPVGEEYRQKVEQSIEKLGYKVNIYARGLKAQKTNTVAVIVPNLIYSFYAVWVNCIEEELSKRDIKLLLCISNENAKKEAAYIEMAKQNKVDGIIGITYSDIDKYVNDDLPFVSIDRHFKSSIQCVASDNYHGGELAAEKLIETGCKNLLYFRSGSNIEGETLKRASGFTDYCEKRHVNHEIYNYEGASSYLSPKDSRKRINEFFQSHMKGHSLEYDGIFASNDLLAVTILEELNSFGIKVPEDAQIIGYDGIKKWNEGDPLVSSIEQPIGFLAEKCVENVLKLIAKEKVEAISILPVRFVEGGTTK